MIFKLLNIFSNSVEITPDEVGFIFSSNLSYLSNTTVFPPFCYNELQTHIRNKKETEIVWLKQ